MGSAVIPLRQSAVETALKNEAFDHLPSPSLCLNASAQILAANRALARLVGVEVQDLVGRNLNEILSVPSTQLLGRRWSRFWTRLLERRALAQRVRVAIRGGNAYSFEMSAALLRSEDDPIAVVHLRESDAHAGARLAAARAAAFGDGSPESVLLLASDRRVLVTGGATRDLLGVPAAGTLGVPFEYLVDEPTAREFLAAFEQVGTQPARSSVALTGAARAFSGHVSPRRFTITLINFLGHPRVHGVLARVRSLGEYRTPGERVEQLRQRAAGLGQVAADLTVLADEAGVVLWQMPGADAGLAPAGLEGLQLADLFLEDDRPGLARALRATADSADGSRRRSFLARARTADGAMRTLWLSLRNALDDPDVRAIVVSGSDVSALVDEAGSDARQARQIELRDRLLQLAVQSRADFVQSLSGVLRSSADSLRAAQVGFWRHEVATGALVCESIYSRLEQRFLREWTDTEFPAQGVVEPLSLLLERAPLALTDTLADGQERDGRWRAVRALLSAPVLLQGEVIGAVCVTDSVPRRWEDEEVGFISTAALMVALAVEAAQRVEAEGRVERLAWYDPLTGLPNRNLLRERLRDTIAAGLGRKRRIAVLLIDLDRFKDVNDTLGHLVGDALIKAAAEVLKEVVGSEGTVARLGGDEFVVLVEKFVHRQEVALLAQRLALAMHRSDLVPHVVTQVSASIGVALYPEHGREIGSLLKNADAAMVQAKRDGRNQVSFFNPIRFERAAREVRLGTELLRALQEETAQFFLEYQPQVEIATGRVIGLEALIRWRHPVHGVLTPDRFIAIAESSGLSEHITRWVMEEAGSQIARWRDLVPGFEIPVSINVAGRELGSSVLPILVRSTLARHDIRPDMISIEITERTLVRDGEINNDVVAEIASLGVGLVLDDFGTGYSTLGYLKRLPIRALKIDRTFIEGVPHDDDSCAIVSAMLTMARHFRLQVVAEGVENARQGAYLRELGCELAQGHYYSRPLSATAISGHLARAGAIMPMASTPADVA